MRSNPALSFDSFSVSGYASPDGSLSKNKELSLRRAVALHNYLADVCGVPDSLINYGGNIVPWELFREMMAASGYPWRDKALKIMHIGSDEDPVDHNRRLNRLRALADSSAWPIIRRDFLPGLRSAFVVTAVISVKNEEDAPIHVMGHSGAQGGSLIQNDSLSVKDILPRKHNNCGRNPRLALTSNLLLDALAIPNLSLELSLHPKWSVGVSGCYSAWNYFRRDLKFRTLTLMPELRFRPRRRPGTLAGFFLDVHGGCAWYNVALGGSKRYQDRDGKSPALGGGFGFGWRLPIGSSPWIFEFALGAGVYRLDYDVFDNRPDGRLRDRVKRWRIIPDKVAVSVGYVISRHKKGGGL